MKSIFLFLLSVSFSLVTLAQANNVEQPLATNSELQSYGSEAQEVCAALSKKLHGYYAKYKDQLSAECTVVRPVLTVTQNGYMNWNGIFTLRWNYSLPSYTSSATASVELYCTPRTLVEKQVLSVYKSCEVNTRPECFSKEYLDYLATVKHTVFINNVAACETQK